MRSLGSLHRAATLCDRHRASLHDPHSASSHPPAPKKAGLCLFVVVEVGRGCRIAVVGVAASCSDSVRPPSCILARPAQCEFAPPSTKKSRAMPVCCSGSGAGLSNCGRWGRCIVQRLCATAIVHPCTTRTVRVRTPQHQKKQGYACLGITLLFWCRWRGSNPHGIATNGF